MGKKSADFLADCFEHYADTHRPYIFGTYGLILTLARLERCARDYPARLSPARVEYAKKHYIGKRTDDCSGGQKNVAWLPGDDPDADPVYDPKTDWSADTTFSKATVKGPIGTIPKRRGICVRYKGHTGVLVDPVKMIVSEFRGFDYGCVRTRLSERGWTDWFEHPLFDYSTTPTPTPAPQPTPQPTPEVKYVTIEMPVLRKGDKIQAVKTMQACLDVYGYGLEIDGSFGGKSDTALRDFQKKHGLTSDGVCGKNTWNALLK